jgi:hypothetical protein
MNPSGIRNADFLNKLYIANVVFEHFQPNQPASSPASQRQPTNQLRNWPGTSMTPDTSIFVIDYTMRASFLKHFQISQPTTKPGKQTNQPASQPTSQPASQQLRTLHTNAANTPLAGASGTPTRFPNINTS